MNHTYSLLGVIDRYVVRTTLYLRQLLFSQCYVPQWQYNGTQCCIFWYRLFYPEDRGTGSSKMLLPVYHQTAQSIIT